MYAERGKSAAPLEREPGMPEAMLSKRRLWWK